MPSRQLLIGACLVAGIAAMSLLIGRRGVVYSAEPVVVTGPAPEAVERALPADVPDEVARFLANGQYWRAARVMRAHLATSDASPEAILVAARAEGGWGGWERVRTYLDGRPWLDSVEGGEGWYWLARALEEEGRAADAVRAYDAYLARGAEGAGPRELRVVAELRAGLLLLQRGETERGAARLGAIHERAPELGPWLDLLAAEALAETGDTARTRELAVRADVPELWLRGRRAILTAYEKAGDPAGRREHALRYRGQAGSAGPRAELSLAAARAALELGDSAAAREDLRAAIAASQASGAARTAAGLLEEMPGIGSDDRLAIARILDRHGAETRAVSGYRAWLATRSGTAAERSQVRLDLVRSLFEAGRYPDAIAAAAELEDGPPSIAAEALLLRGRAEYRRGNHTRASEIWLRLAERHPGTRPGSEGLFFVADFAHDDGEEAYASRIYRRVADEFPGTDRAGLSLMRLGGLAFLHGDWSAAARAWDEYRTRYPRGERWLEATYWSGRARQTAGDSASAAALFAAVREREPLSYYSLVAADRQGVPFWPIPTSPDPADDPDRRERVEGWMHGVDLLRAAGLHTEAATEADRRIREAGDDPAILYPLAEALNERGLTLRGIRIGQRLQREAGTPSTRLLRIVNPFPYRALIVAEARERGLDPFVVAALTRQESVFEARISSPAGARGLMQIMPQTGAQLARATRIDAWDPDLLFQPEINVHLGTLYLSDQMRRYDESLPAVFSAYNAGPHRIDRWMRFPEWRDEELFTERIPFRETRDYVKILTRNIAVYRGLYR